MTLFGFDIMAILSGVILVIMGALFHRGNRHKENAKYEKQRADSAEKNVEVVEQKARTESEVSKIKEEAYEKELEITNDKSGERTDLGVWDDNSR